MTTKQKRALWAQRIEEQKKSGLSQREFCKEHSLNYSNFSYYCRKKTKKKDQGKKQFIPIKGNHFASNVQVRTSGAEFSFSNLPDVEWLVSLVKKLSQRHA